MTTLTSGPVESSGTPTGPVHTDDARAWVEDRAAKMRALLPAHLATAAVPTFASPAWLALDPTDPRRWVSALRAALAWANDADPHVLAARLDAELDAAWRDAERDYAGWHQIAERVRASASTPDHAELQRRRQQAPTDEQEVA